MELFGFQCSCCGEYHAEIPLNFGADVPDYVLAIPVAERESRCQMTADLCVIDGTEFFVRGILEVPVRDGAGPFTWGVWTTLSAHNFQRTWIC